MNISPHILKRINRMLSENAPTTMQPPSLSPDQAYPEGAPMRPNVDQPEHQNYWASHPDDDDAGNENWAGHLGLDSAQQKPDDSFQPSSLAPQIGTGSDTTGRPTLSDVGGDDSPSQINPFHPRYSN